MFSILEKSKFFLWGKKRKKEKARVYKVLVNNGKCGRIMDSFCRISRWGVVDAGPEPAAAVVLWQTSLHESEADCVGKKIKLHVVVFSLCRSFEVLIRAENATAAQSTAPLRWAGETMEPFFPFPEKKEDRKNSALMSDLRWLTHTLVHNVTILHSPNHLQGFCADRGPGCVCLGEIGIQKGAG